MVSGISAFVVSVSFSLRLSDLRVFLCLWPSQDIVAIAKLYGVLHTLYIQGVGRGGRAEESVVYIAR